MRVAMHADIGDDASGVHDWPGVGNLLSRRLLYLVIKALISGAMGATVSEVAKRYPGFGGPIASLPPVLVLGMIWLWRDARDLLSAWPIMQREHFSLFCRPCRCSWRSRPC